MTDLPTYSEGDTLEFRGNTYTVETVDVLVRYDEPDRIIQYCLEAVDGPPAILEPGEDSFVVKEFHEVDPDGVERDST